MYSLIDKVERLYSSEKLKPVYSSFLDTVTRYDMQSALSGGLAVGFSGGADSVMLLLLLMKYRRDRGSDSTILAVHINHSIRGATADRDADFSRSFCASLGVGFHLETVDVPLIASAQGIGIEEAARDARYFCFDKIIHSRNDISAFALAHNSTDNVETVVLNMLRGSGIRGMAGIPPVRDFYYRPLLSINKETILSLLDGFEIPYVHDETNDADDYSRNYVRHNVLPHFRTLNSSYDITVRRMTEHMRSAADLISMLSENAYAAIKDSETFSVSHLRPLHSVVLANLISKLIRDRVGFYPDEMHINAIVGNVTQDNFRVSLKSADFVCQRGVCFFDFHSKKISDDVIFELKAGENKIQGTNTTVWLELGPNFKVFSPNIYNYSIYAEFDGDIINNGVYLRFKREGDSYRYGGITRRLKKVFNDKGIPPFMRGDIPVICDNKGILWVAGLGVRDDARHGSTGSLMRITILFDESDGRKLYTARNFTDENI